MLDAIRQRLDALRCTTCGEIICICDIKEEMEQFYSTVPECDLCGHQPAFFHETTCPKFGTPERR